VGSEQLEERDEPKAEVRLKRAARGAWKGVECRNLRLAGSDWCGNRNQREGAGVLQKGLQGDGAGLVRYAGSTAPNRLG